VTRKALSVESCITKAAKDSFLTAAFCAWNWPVDAQDRVTRSHSACTSPTSALTSHPTLALPWRGLSAVAALVPCCPCDRLLVWAPRDQLLNLLFPFLVGCETVKSLKREQFAVLLFCFSLRLLGVRVTRGSFTVAVWRGVPENWHKAYLSTQGFSCRNDRSDAYFPNLTSIRIHT
jgi:hypothetical protein